jgi:hypothetical protein
MPWHRCARKLPRAATGALASFCALPLVRSQALQPRETWCARMWRLRPQPEKFGALALACESKLPPYFELRHIV